MFTTTALIFLQFIWNPQRLVVEQHAFNYKVCADMEGHTSVFDPTDWRCHYLENDLFRHVPTETLEDRQKRCDSVDIKGVCNAPRNRDERW